MEGPKMQVAAETGSSIGGALRDARSLGPTGHVGWPVIHDGRASAEPTFQRQTTPHAAPSPDRLGSPDAPERRRP